MTPSLILTIVAVVLFALAAVNVKVGSLNLVAAGLACWALSTLL